MIRGCQEGKGSSSSQQCGRSAGQILQQELMAPGRSDRGKNKTHQFYFQFSIERNSFLFSQVYVGRLFCEGQEIKFFILWPSILWISASEVRTTGVTMQGRYHDSKVVWHDVSETPSSVFCVAIVLLASARVGQKSPCRSDLGIVNWIVSEVKLRIIF